MPARRRGLRRNSGQRRGRTWLRPWYRNEEERSHGRILANNWSRRKLADGRVFILPSTVVDGRSRFRPTFHRHRLEESVAKRAAGTGAGFQVGDALPPGPPVNQSRRQCPRPHAFHHRDVGVARESLHPRRPAGVHVNEARRNRDLAKPRPRNKGKSRRPISASPPASAEDRSGIGLSSRPPGCADETTSNRGRPR